jgi:hypothetical protein
MANQSLSFGQAVEAMKEGLPVSRASWDQKNGGFVFRQVPSLVPAEIIPRMTSLPEAVKQLVLSRSMPMQYENQLAFVDSLNHACSWDPTVEDVLATDWLVCQSHVTASETVGTATPLE